MIDKASKDIITSAYTDLVTSLSPPVAEVLVSYPCSDTRHRTMGYMTCAKCGDKRQMMKQGPEAYQCQGCGQRWKYPPA